MEEDSKKYQEWNPSRIRAFAPDEHTWSRAQRLAHPPVWLSRFRSEHFAWGECRGAEGAVYFVEADLAHPAFRCSCPVKKQPCKHGLALMLLLQNYPQAWISTDTPPLKTVAWSKQRQIDSATKAQRKQAPENQALRLKNREKRLQTMTDGFLQLDAWLRDLIRQGLAAVESQPYTFWEQIAARMTDAKLGSVARRLRQLAIPDPDLPRHTQILHAISELFLLSEAFKRKSLLPQDLTEDLLATAGLNQRKEDLEGLPAVEDLWVIRAVEEGKDEQQLRYRRVWLQRHACLQFALFLDFAWGENPFESTWTRGEILEGSIVYFPSAFPLRAVPVSLKPVSIEPVVLMGVDTLGEAARLFAEALSQNPWLLQLPLSLNGMVPVYHDKKFYFSDGHGASCLLDIPENDGFRILAESGGYPIQVFGIWKNGAFRPIL